jgi:hypothetical protein
MSRVKYADGGIVTLHSSTTTFTAPSAITSGGLYVSARIGGFAPPDVIIRIKGTLAWAFDKATGVFGMLEDGTWDRAETPLGGGGLLSGLAAIGQSYAVAMGGYKRLAISAWDGGTLTASQAVVVYAIPAYLKEI